MVSKNSNNFIPVSNIVEFAMDNISEIQTISEIKKIWNNKIIDITNERHDLMRDYDPIAFSKTHMVVGQDNYFFSFRESSDIYGEFSVDFIPVDPSKILREALVEKIEKKLVNWRVQVFFEGVFSRRKAFKKHLTLLRFLHQKFGEPINDYADINWALQIKEAIGDCDLWEFAIRDRLFAVTLRTLPPSESHVDSVSFSVSELI